MVNGLCYKLLYFSNNLTVHIYVYTIAGVEPHILLLFILERRGGQGETKNIQRCEARAVCSLTCSSHSKFICSFSLFFFGRGRFISNFPFLLYLISFWFFFFSCVSFCLLFQNVPDMVWFFFLAVTFQGLMEIGYVSKAKENWLFAGIDLIYFLKTVNFLWAILIEFHD